MNLRAIGCNVASAAVELRERLAFNPTKTQTALTELNARFAAEAVVLDTCNRVEIYVSRQDAVAPLHIPLMAEFLAEIHGVPASEIVPHLYEHADAQAAKHLFRVASGLDSGVFGESQIAGQVKDAYEVALKSTATGPLLNTLFPARCACPNACVPRPASRTGTSPCRARGGLRAPRCSTRSRTRRCW